jgi:hypothetical protein
MVNWNVEALMLKKTNCGGYWNKEGINEDHSCAATILLDTLEPIGNNMYSPFHVW